MSDAQGQSGFDPHQLYFAEKAYFAGVLISAILYGTLIVLFFQCVVALLNPAHRRTEGVKWGLISYTVVIFSVATAITGMQLNNQSISYIDNRDFPGVEGVYPRGPYGYSLSILSKALGIVPNSLFLLNYCLADGLLLYRCYIFYSRSLWVIAIPCLMYLGSVGTGILWVHNTTGPRHDLGILHTGLPYYSVTVSLNVLLTLMIVVRLILLGRRTCATEGCPPGISGLYKAVVTMLIESSALYAVNSLVVIGLCAPDCDLANTFLLMLGETQVIAPLLIIQRVANNSALTGNTVVSGPNSSFETGSRGKPMGSPGSGYPMTFFDERGMKSSGLEVGVETTSDFHRDSKV